MQANMSMAAEMDAFTISSAKVHKLKAKVKELDREDLENLQERTKSQTEKKITFLCQAERAYD